MVPCNRQPVLGRPAWRIASGVFFWKDWIFLEGLEQKEYKQICGQDEAKEFRSPVCRVDRIE
jgi:hypothetical protein